MAGVKGRSGGARPNTGGARPGAGRPPKEPAVTGEQCPLAFLRKVWSGEIDASPSQVRAASAALPYMHPRIGEAGKKAAKTERAQAVSAYAPSAAPLKLVGARK